MSGKKIIEGLEDAVEHARAERLNPSLLKLVQYILDDPDVRERIGGAVLGHPVDAQQAQNVADEILRRVEQRVPPSQNPNTVS